MAEQPQSEPIGPSLSAAFSELSQLTGFAVKGCVLLSFEVSFLPAGSVRIDEDRLTVVPSEYEASDPGACILTVPPLSAYDEYGVDVLLSIGECTTLRVSLSCAVGRASRLKPSTAHRVSVAEGIVNDIEARVRSMLSETPTA